MPASMPVNDETVTVGDSSPSSSLDVTCSPSVLSAMWSLNSVLIPPFDFGFILAVTAGHNVVLDKRFFCFPESTAVTTITPFSFYREDLGFFTPFSVYEGRLIPVVRARHVARNCLQDACYVCFSTSCTYYSFCRRRRGMVVGEVGHLDIRALNNWLLAIAKTAITN